MAEAVVRMGEAAASATPGDTLACIGLGSCIGLVLVDRARSVAALAHVMLPSAPAEPQAQPYKFADLAVSALLDLALAHGALKPRLEAAIVGGAAMFQFGAGGSGQDIGARNESAVRGRLDGLGIPLRAAATGGGRGRTVRIFVGPDVAITVREAGGREEALLGAPMTVGVAA
ncbi:MAG: chemotaxis protein CheD [Solirubrobacterales bacterium]|nr:chemotaxis protein CheD [Solirubrobacterales bacterium]